jgi:predicted nucleic acid-binding protein
VIPVNLTIIEKWSDLISSHSRTLPFVDSLLAATCLALNLTLLTRNIKDFDDIPQLKLQNPWDGAGR